MSETNIIGKDVWWDTELQEFKPKRINLDKVPLKFRCPKCGKIVVKPQDREPLRIKDKEDEAIKDKEIDRLFKIEKPSKEEWDNFVKRHEELFTPLIHLVERGTPIDLTWYGGVCKNCWLDGFGKNGAYGAFMKKQLEKDEEKYNKNDDKAHLWINGKLKLVNKVIEIDLKDGGS